MWLANSAFPNDGVPGASIEQRKIPKVPIGILGEN
jgi:hypothetical protein